MRHVYETVITNDAGLSGVVKADSGYTFTTDGVKFADQNHTNPEQLIGASWATCLNATLHSVLKLKGIEPVTRVEVKVDLFLDEVTRFEFHLHAKIAIKDVSKEDALEIVEMTHRFCPVSKLLEHHKDVSWEIVEY